jgi:aryl-alcohol dehydrogenase-like predicted oxidoreductase
MDTRCHAQESLIDSVHDNLRNLGVEALDVVNLRAWGDNGQAPGEEPLTEPLSVLAELKQQGLIRHLGTCRPPWLLSSSEPSAVRIRPAREVR